MGDCRNNLAIPVSDLQTSGTRDLERGMCQTSNERFLSHSGDGLSSMPRM